MFPVPTGAAPTPPPPVWDRTAAFLYVPGELLGLGWGKAFHPLAVAVQEGFLGMGASPPLATWVPRCSSSLLPPGTWGWQCSASPLPPRCRGERAVPFVSRVSFLPGGRMGIFSRHCSAQEAAIRRVGRAGKHRCSPPLGPGWAFGFWFWLGSGMAPRADPSQAAPCPHRGPQWDYCAHGSVLSYRKT